MDQTPDRGQVEALVAAAIVPEQFSEVVTHGGMHSLSYLLEKPVEYRDAPDMFCLDLYKYQCIDGIPPPTAPSYRIGPLIQTSRFNPARVRQSLPRGFGAMRIPGSRLRLQAPCVILVAEHSCNGFGVHAGHQQETGSASARQRTTEMQQLLGFCGRIRRIASSLPELFHA
jgi:hypothetical protein